MQTSGKVLRWLNIAFATVILISLAKIFLIQAPTPVVTTTGMPKQLNLDGVRWNHERTIVLFLQSTCKFCHQSASFHYELSQLARSQGWGVLAVFPESVAVAQVSLERLGLEIPAIESDLSLLGISGTPTIAIVDGKGTITSAWAGLLDDQRKREVFEAIGVLPKAAAAQGNRLKPKGLQFETLSISDARAVLSNASTVLLDIRSRESYRSAHLKGAINIPRDELEIRAFHELDKSRKIVVFCQYLPECEKANEEVGLMTNCTIGAWFLKKAGYDAALLQSDISTMSRNGYLLSQAATSTDAKLEERL